MRRALLFCAAIAFAIACGDSITEPVPPTPPVSFATSTSDDGLSITTDKDDYAPGDTVHFTGTGWQAEDVLDIVLVDDAVTGESHTWTVTVGEDGTFHDSTYVVDTDDLGVTFTLTATSRATGRSLTVVFTDGVVRVGTGPAGISFQLIYSEHTGAGCTGNPSTTTVTVGSNGLQLSPNPSNANSVLLRAAANSSDAPAGAFTSWSGPANSFDAGVPPRSICVRPFNGNRTFNAGYNAPDLTIAKQAVGTFQIGENATYKLTVSNASGVTSVATSGTITVTDKLPGQVDFVSGTDANWTCGLQGQNVECTTAATIAPGASAPDITLVVAVTTGQNVKNDAEVKGGGEPSGNEGNNTVSITTPVLAASAKKLAFTSPLPSFTADKNVCSSLITVQTQTTNGLPVSPSPDLTVNLSSSSAGGKFFSDAGCITQTTARTILSTGNSTSFYYKDSVCGSPVLTAAGGSLTPASQTESISGAGCANQAPTVQHGTYSGAEGAGIALNPTVTDPDGDNLTYLWTVDESGIDTDGDCTLSNATQKNATVTCDDDSKDASDGTFSVNLRVDDGNGHTVDAAADLTVTNANPTANVGGPYSTNEGTAKSVSGTGQDQGTHDVLTFVWSVDETGIDTGGDCDIQGTTATATVTCDDDSEDLSSGHFTVSLKVTDDDGGESAVSSANLTVLNVAPTAVAGGPYSTNEGTAKTLTGTGDDDGDNDILSYEWSVDKTGIDGLGSCDFSPDNAEQNPSLECDDDSEAATGGHFTVSLKVTDDDGDASPLNPANFTVANVAPAMQNLTQSDVNSSALPATILFGGTLGIKAVFDDDGDNDTHKAFLDCGSGSGHVDGTGDDTSPVTTSCTFTSIGLKTIVVRVLDDDGDDDVKTHNITVVYGFDGFYAPVDRPTTMNVSKAGQAIPLKWRLTDANGVGITNVTEVSVKSIGLPCNYSTLTDNIEEYAGASGLLNLGNGYYQFNWKTPPGYAGTCKTISLIFGSTPNTYTEGPHAYFSFKK